MTPAGPHINKEPEDRRKSITDKLLMTLIASSVSFTGTTGRIGAKISSLMRMSSSLTFFIIVASQNLVSSLIFPPRTTSPFVPSSSRLTRCTWWSFTMRAMLPVSCGSFGCISRYASLHASTKASWKCSGTIA